MASRGCLYRTAKVIKRTSRTFFSRKLLIRRVLVTLAVVVCSTSLETLLQSQNLTHGNYRIQLKVLSQLFVLYESTDCFRTQYSRGNHSCRALIQKALACALRPPCTLLKFIVKRMKKENSLESPPGFLETGIGQDKQLFKLNTAALHLSFNLSDF